MSPLGLGLSMTGPRASGPPATDPAGLPNCQIWLRADKGITFSSGSLVSGWADQSGHSATNSYTDLGFTAMDPTQIASDTDFNNHSSIDFGTATNNGLATSQGSFTGISQPNTIYAVCKFHSLSGVPLIMDTISNGGNRQFLYAAPATWDMYAGAFITGGTSDATTVHVFGMIFNSTTSKLYVDSSAATVASGDANTGNFGGPLLADQVQIGGFNASATPGTGASVSSNAKIAEFVVYSGAHTAGNVHTVFAALAARYGQSWT